LSESLEEVKNRLSRSYLGRAGIHGFGLHRAAKSVRVYVDSDCYPLAASVLSELEDQALPYLIEVVPESRASLH
jgi:hypothetical protein